MCRDVSTLHKLKEIVLVVLTHVQKGLGALDSFLRHERSKLSGAHRADTFPICKWSWMIFPQTPHWSWHLWLVGERLCGDPSKWWSPLAGWCLHLWGNVPPPGIGSRFRRPTRLELTMNMNTGSTSGYCRNLKFHMHKNWYSISLRTWYHPVEDRWLSSCEWYWNTS